MSTEGHPTKASLRELEPLFAEVAGRDRAAVRHSTLRLQPTILPPPPQDDGASAPVGATHEDDLDLGLEADNFARRRQWLLAAAGVAIAIAGTVAYLAFGPVQAPKQEAVTRPPPVVVTPPPQVAPAPPVVATPPALAPAAPSAIAPPVVSPPAAPVVAAPVAAAPAAAGAADKSMGQVSDELIAPVTEGLSPARKVDAIRIVVDGDREIRPQ